MTITVFFFYFFNKNFYFFTFRCKPTFNYVYNMFYHALTVTGPAEAMSPPPSNVTEAVTPELKV